MVGTVLYLLNENNEEHTFGLRCIQVENMDVALCVNLAWGFLQMSHPA